VELFVVHEQMLSAFPGGLPVLQSFVGWMKAFDIVLLCTGSHHGVCSQMPGYCKWFSLPAPCLSALQLNDI
jgi:hypothetical protein